MSNASPLTLFLIRYPVIIFSLIMLVAGLLGLVFGRLSIGPYKNKRGGVPDLMRHSLPGRSRLFHPEIRVGGRNRPDSR